jgi:hypothetical protein
VRAQHRLLAAGLAVDVEGVGARSRGVRGAVVERVEVVVDGLDLGTLHHGEAQPEEHVFELAHRRGDDVQAPDRLRRSARQGDVDAVAPQLLAQLGAGQLAGPRLDQPLQRNTGLVGGLAHDAPFRRRQLAHAAQHLRQLGLAP